jgi:ABC-type transport system substrate-binding protein/class 3 adenylate cyclase/tetratricopeptide (TPR) repeat protein
MAVATGERRIVSVLVADVVGSTAIGETLGPERSKFLIDEVMRIMTEQVRRFDGTVAQLVGDELLALFGVPVSHEDDAERALRAALAIQRALAQYAQEVEAAYGVQLAVRIGVNTGPVVVGVQGDGEDGYDPFNALGDTVNVASRLQEIAGQGGVVIGPTTKRQVETNFELEEMGAQDLKGLGSPLDTFRVMRALESEPAPPSLPLVGRDFELTVLERTMDALVEGRGAIVSIIGEPGIGKTRLVWEVRDRYRERARFIEARGVSYAQNFPYWPIRDLLREWLGVGATTPEARVRLELKAELAHLLGKEEADDAYPFLASLVGLTLEPEAQGAIKELNRESIQSRTFEVFFELVCKLAEEEPLCLVFEDVHWADEATLELIETTLGITDESAVALFFLCRPERDHGSWRLIERARQLYPHRYREVEVRPLPADSSRILVSHAAEGDLPESVAELLAERSGGNPFFLEEAIRDLIERGALQRRNGGWELAVDVDELAIPAAVQGTLQARLDRLDPQAREVLSLAAVIGRTFGLPLLERLVPDDLMQALSELQRLDLIVEKRRRPNLEYRFRHGLVQEVAYASLVDSKRRKLHKRVGEALESILQESPEEAYGLLARHFTEADEPEKAVEYLLKAGDAARAVYADKEALDHYAKARVYLARIGDERRARDTLFKMALAYHVAFDFEKAEEMYDEAFSCGIPEDPRLPSTERLETASGRPGELSPGEVYSTEGGYFAELLFRGLLMVDSELNVVPAMADNFRVSSDGLTYLFRIKEDARWSDGEPVTADDYAYAWRRMREQETRTAILMEDVETAEPLDDRTLEVRLREPRSYFPYVLCSAWAFPWPRHRCEALGDEWATPENLVGNGPYVLVEYDDDHALLQANPYWAGARGNIGEIHFSFYSKGARMIEGWQEGHFDLLHVWDILPEDEPLTLSEVVSELSLQYVGFRADRAPFSNELVRKAFCHAVDRDLLVSQYPRAGLYRAASRGGAIPPAMPAHSHRVGLEYDLEKARALLDEAGYPGGKGLPEIEVIVPHWLQPLEPLAELWKPIGARVNITTRKAHVDWDALGDAHMWWTGWTADYPDPDGFFRGLLTLGQWPFYRDDDILELLERGRSLRDQGERMRVYHEVDHLWVGERAAILPIAYPRSNLLRRPWIEGLWASALSRAHLDTVVVGDRTAFEPEAASAVPVPDEA